MSFANEFNHWARILDRIFIVPLTTYHGTCGCYFCFSEVGSKNFQKQFFKIEIFQKNISKTYFEKKILCEKLIFLKFF